MKNWLKKYLLNYLLTKNLDIVKVAYFDTTIRGKLNIHSNIECISDKTINNLISFFEKFDLMYQGNEVNKELEIRGGWKALIEDSMPNVLKSIRNKDWKTYSSLLESMFRNEVIYGLWDYKFFDNSDKPPADYLASIDGYQFITGRSVDSLFTSKFGNPWGLESKQGLISMIAGDAGVKAFNIMNLINGKSGPVVLDLGSGYGADMMELANSFIGPIRIILCDIPITLATAYFQISMNFPDNVTLIENRDDLAVIMSSPVTKLEFILTPSIFVDELSKFDIDVLHNHGSLAEMDFETANFYLNLLVTKRLGHFLEMNAAAPHIWDTKFTELDCKNFLIPSTHYLISRTPMFLSSKGKRYTQSLYAQVH